jgi:hypothetical protein
MFIAVLPQTSGIVDQMTIKMDSMAKALAKLIFWWDDGVPHLLNQTTIKQTYAQTGM